MSSRIAEAYVQIVPRIDGVASGISGQLSGEMGGAGEASARSFSSGFRSILGPAFALAATAAVIGFVKSSVTAAQEAQVASQRIDAIAESMNLFGSNTQAVSARVQSFAESQERLLAVDADVIKAAQAKLLTFKDLAITADEAGGAFDRATLASVDLAAAGFGSAETNAIQLGKALQDPIKGITALSRSGITFTEAEKEKIRVLTESGQLLEAQNMILGAVETQVGGTAAATATSSERMRLAFESVKDSVGFALLPVLDQLSLTLGPIIESLGPSLAAIFSALVPIIMVLAESMPLIVTVLETLAPLFTLLLEAIAEIVAAALPFFVELIQALLPIIEALIPPVIDIVKAFLPLIPALLAIALAIIPIIELLLPVLIELLNFVIPIIVVVANIISAVLGFAIKVLVAALGGLISFLPTVLSVFITIFKGIANFVIGIVNFIIGAFEGMVNFVIMGINLMIGALNKLKFDVPDWVPLIGGQKFGFNLSKVASISLGRIPQLAEGGFVDQPTTAIIGEAGPEVVTPLKDFERMMGMDGQGRGQTINYYAAPNQSLDAEQALFQAIKRAKVVTGW